MKIVTTKLLGIVLLTGILMSNASAEYFGVPAAVDMGPNDLPRLVNQYADRVGTCLNVPGDKQTPCQKMWLRDRQNNTNKIYSCLASQPTPYTVQDLIKNRSKLCDTVLKSLVDKAYLGKQYGNCGEGSMVNYCLAHRAGLKNIIRCSSKNDHAFALFLNPGNAYGKDTICIMDRWALGPNKSERTRNWETKNIFCDVSIKNGSVHHRGRKLNNKWYEDVSCKDWTIAYGHQGDKVEFKNFNVKTWKDSYLVKDFRNINKRIVANLLGIKINKIDYVKYAKLESGKIKVDIHFNWINNKKALAHIFETISEKFGEGFPNLPAQIEYAYNQKKPFLLEVEVDDLKQFKRAFKRR